MKKKVGIVITTYNQTILLKKCLESLKKVTDYKEYSVVLVDDSGHGKIGKEISKKFPWVKVLINKKNLGCSKSFNIGANWLLKNSSPDYYLWFNDDAEIIQKNWLSEMVKIGEKDPKAGIIGCKIIYPDGRFQSLGGYMEGWKIEKAKDTRKKKVFEVDHIMGAVMLIKKEVVEKIGFLDKIYSPFLLEDTDYCLRAKEAGFKVLSVPSVEVAHNKGKSINTIVSRKSLYNRFKNDITFSRRHLKFKDRVFRIFVYLPMLAVFSKKTDEAELKFRNFYIKKGFLINIAYLIKAYFVGFLSR
jgi:O-antigen biosynthesis protein